MYIDNIKIFAKNEKELETLIKKLIDLVWFSLVWFDGTSTIVDY